MTDRTDPTELLRALGEELNDLLKRAGLSGKALAERVGWQPSKVSKIVNARQTPSQEDIAAWAHACHAQGETDRLLGLLRAIHTERVDWRHQMRAGMSPVQVDYNRLHAESRDIRYFETAVVPGPLQIRAYAEVILREVATVVGTTVVDVDAAVTTRLQRQQYLYEPHRSYTFLIAEPVLRWRMWPAEVMRAQLDRLLSAAELPSVTVAVLPLDRSLMALPQHSFAIYDDLAIVDTATTELVCRDAEAAIYRALFERLMADAATGGEARQMIRDAITALADS